MEAEITHLDRSLIAVRCAGVDPIASAATPSVREEMEFEPRMCCNDSSLTGSGGDFAFTAPRSGATSS
jgi:hypothetical protein